jgi:hypothetical protein
MGVRAVQNPLAYFTVCVGLVRVFPFLSQVSYSSTCYECMTQERLLVVLVLPRHDRQLPP